MSDLSKVQTRITETNRLTRNRDSIMPARRDTEAPQRRVFADVRNGARGDGGVEELRRVLGLVQGAANSFQDYAETKHKKQEEDYGSQGLLDEAAGKSDPELLRKSLAYRSSVYTQRAQSRFFENAEKLDDEIKSVINSDDPTLADPVKRSAAVEAAIDRNFKEFALDPDTGKLRDWGAPGAAKWLGPQLAELRASVRSKALQQIETKANEDSITQASNALRASIRAGIPMKFEDSFKTLLPTVDRGKAKAAFLKTATEEVSTLGDEADRAEEAGDLEKAQELRTRGVALIDSIRGARREAAPLAAPQGVPEADTSKPYYTGASQQPSLAKQFSAVEHIESRGNQGAVSPKGAVGVMQVMPGTGPEAARLAGVAWDPQRFKADAAYNRQLGQAYYTDQLRRFGGDPLKAAAAYNAGPGRVGKLVEQHGSAWRDHLPAETKAYVTNFAKATGAKPAEKPWETGPAVPKDILDPKTPTQVAEASGGESLLTEPQGAFSLTPDERSDLNEFRRRFTARIDKAAQAAREQRQDANALDFMGRLHGMGAYPTTIEVQAAARRGDINVRQAVQLLGIAEQDAREVRAEEREATAELRAQKAEARETKLETISNSSNVILGKLLSGKYWNGARGAQDELMRVMGTIPDAETRQAVFSEVSRGISAAVDLKNATPEYRRAMQQFDEWEAVYLDQLGKGRQISIPDRGRAAVVVKNWLNSYRVRLSEYAALPPDKVAAFMQRAEKDLDGFIDQRFPTRASRAASTSAASTRSSLP